MKKGTAREQLLEMATLQAQVQGKSLAEFLRELQASVDRLLPRFMFWYTLRVRVTSNRLFLLAFCQGKGE